MSPEPIGPEGIDELLRLNNDHAEELSALDADSFRTLAAQAFFAKAMGTQAFIFAFDQDAAYGSPNFIWFRDRYSRFVYVDRIAVSPTARGLGRARTLYEALFHRARVAGHERIVCEVNVRPPNPGSDAFHERFGFNEVGRAEIHGGAKAVRYLECRLGRA